MKRWPGELLQHPRRMFAYSAFCAVFALTVLGWQLSLPHKVVLVVLLLANSIVSAVVGVLGLRARSAAKANSRPRGPSGKGS